MKTKLMSYFTKIKRKNKFLNPLVMKENIIWQNCSLEISEYSIFVKKN